MEMPALTVIPTALASGSTEKSTRNFTLHFFTRMLFSALVDADFLETDLPEAQQNRDLGWMLYDIDFANGRTPQFFRARLEGGVIDVAGARNAGLAQ